MLKPTFVETFTCFRLCNVCIAFLNFCSAGDQAVVRKTGDGHVDMIKLAGNFTIEQVHLCWNPVNSNTNGS